MIVHLEIYVVNQQGETQEAWRRSLTGLDGCPSAGMIYLLESKSSGAKWFFPNADGMVGKGEYYYVNREVFVSWVQVSQAADFSDFGFRVLIGNTWG